MNIWFDKDNVKFPEGMPVEGWFKVEDIDYLLKDELFVISLKESGEYEMEE